MVLSKIITGGALPAGGVIAAGGPDLSAIIDLFEQQFLSTYISLLMASLHTIVYSFEKTMCLALFMKQLTGVLPA